MSRLARPLVSVVGLIALVAGVPAVLIAVVGWPLPDTLPALSEVRSALGDGWRPGERFVLGVLGLVTWILWAQITRHVVAEMQLRHRAASFEAIPVPGGPRSPSRRLAAWLVGGLVLAGPITAAASSSPSIPVVLAASRALDPPGGPPVVTPPQPAQPEAVSSPTYVVHTWEERRDCLWTIAERYLGDPFRWHELAELNAEVRQPGGQRLADDPRHWVYPGMQLRLPADATGADLRPAPAPGPVVTPASPSQDGSSAASLHAAAPGSYSPAGVLDKESPRPSAAVPSTARPTRADKPRRPVPSNAAERAKEQAPVFRLGRGVILVAQAIGLGLPVFAAGGLVRHLNRRRRVQLARHRPGRDIVRPGAEGETVELKARAIAADEAAEWVDVAMRLLGARLGEAAMAAPAITCVRAGELGLEILLAERRPLAPAEFAVADDGFVWRLHTETELSQLQAEAENHPATAPALVSLGVSPEGPLLVDLEGIGALSVEGAPERVAAFIAGVALELASAPWSDGVDLRLVGADPGLGAVEGVEVVEDCASLVAELNAIATAAGKVLDDHVTTLAARVAEPAEAWFPTVVVVGGSKPPAELERVAECSRPGGGVAVVAPGPFAGAAWRLVIVDDGHARLEPLGLVVRASGAPRALASDLGHLDHQAVAAAAELLSAASHDEDVAPLAKITPEPAHASSPALVRRDHEVWVKVLGPVEVTGWAKPIGPRRKYEEIVAYLATHDKAVGAERLRTAVWPDKELDPKSFREAISRLRSHLGRDHLPPAVRGTYRLGGSVGGDWTSFRELSVAARAARDDESNAMALWREALELVRGEPFGGGLHEASAYGWAYSEMLVYDMQREITEAADALAELALANDDIETTLWATRQGHLATPGQLSLFDWQMRVAHRRRDADGLKLAYRARRLAEQALDPTADVLPETAQLYHRLLSEIVDVQPLAGHHERSRNGRRASQPQH